MNLNRKLMNLINPSRIAIISGGYIFNASGSEKGARALAEALAKRVAEVHVFTFYVRNHPVKCNGVHIHPVLNRLLPKNMRFIYEYVNSLSTIFKLALLSYKYKIQILNVHDDQMLAIFVGLVGKILKIPVILTWIRNDFGFEGYKKNRKFLAFRNKKLKARLAIKLADKIMLKGILPELFLEKYPVSQEKLFHAPNPIKIPEEIFNNKKYQMQKKDSLNDIFIVTSISTRMEKAKGISNVLRAAKIIKEKNIDDVKFMMIGGRDSLTVDFWSMKSKEYQIEDYIIFAGFQNNVYPFLLNSNIYIFPTEMEVCCSRALLEAMVSELPVVCRKTKSMAYWFKHLNNIYFVDESSPEKFANAILYLKRHESIRKEIGRNARKTVLKVWDVEKFADKFFNICKDQINKREV